MGLEKDDLLKLSKGLTGRSAGAIGRSVVGLFHADGEMNCEKETNRYIHI
jgi:hypothetical protein